MRGHHHGAAPRGDLPEELHDAVGRHRIEVARGLVGQEHLRVVEQRPGDDQTLLLAAREFERHLVALRRELHHVEHLLDALADLRLVAPPGGPEHVVQVEEGVAVGEQLVVLEDDADAAAQVGDVLAAQAAQVEARDISLSGKELHLGI